MLNFIEEDKVALKKLMQIEAGLSSRLDQLSADLSKAHSKDLEEQAVERENDEVLYKLESEANEELLQVKEAIQRINEGKYHKCVKCGHEISPERLEAIPYTTYCIACADTSITN